MSNAIYFHIIQLISSLKYYVSKEIIPKIHLCILRQRCYYINYIKSGHLQSKTRKCKSKCTLCFPPSFEYLQSYYCRVGPAVRLSLSVIRQSQLFLEFKERSTIHYRLARLTLIRFQSFSVVFVFFISSLEDLLIGL